MWRAWFRWHGTRAEQENMRMLHICCAAAGMDRALQRAVDYVKEQYGGPTIGGDPILDAAKLLAEQQKIPRRNLTYGERL